MGCLIDTEAVDPIHGQLAFRAGDVITIRGVKYIADKDMTVDEFSSISDPEKSGYFRPAT